MAKTMLFFLLLSLLACNDTNSGADKRTAAPDPLPSWNNGPTKDAILAFVRQVADSGAAGFIPSADRIATFDNDGTLWAEQPLVQEAFALWMAQKILGANPGLAAKQPFKAIAAHDMSYFKKGGEKALIQLVIATHTGTTEAEFEKNVAGFYPQAKVGGRTVGQIVYQPQLELLRYLRANGFKTYICTGGTVEFVRGISDSLYGIPKEQVIGTSFRYTWNDDTHTLKRDPQLDHFNDKEGKPVGIQLHIGRPPVFACGNEGGKGDIAMLHFSQSSPYPSFQLIINHDDSTREFYYQEKDDASLNAARAGHWHVVSMKTDWKTIFPSK